MEQEHLFGIEGLSELGWDVPEEIGLRDWIDGMERVQAMENVGPWAIGDGMRAGLVRFGDDAWQGLHVHYGEKTANRILAVVEAFPISRRRPRVSLWKAELMRGLPTADQDRLMEDASEQGMTMETIRGIVDAHETGAQEELIPSQECPACGALSDYWQRVPEGELAER